MTGKRGMEAEIVIRASQQLNLPYIDTLRLWYTTTTYKWFLDDKLYGIAREGCSALTTRFVSEINGVLIK